jgi:hypothetical protein
MKKLFRKVDERLQFPAAPSYRDVHIVFQAMNIALV